MTDDMMKLRTLVDKSAAMSRMRQARGSAICRSPATG